MGKVKQKENENNEEVVGCTGLEPVTSTLSK